MRLTTETSYIVTSLIAKAMNNRSIKSVVFISALLLSCVKLVSVAYAQEAIQDVNIYPSAHDQIIQLVQNTSPQTRQNPQSGNQIFPSTNDRNDREGKKCMTVCARWGEECNYTDRGAAGTTRDCRRTCKQFTEECF